MQRAAGTITITIDINSLVADWTCELGVLMDGAVRTGGRRRSRRSPTPMLLDFFSVDLLNAGILGATAIAVLLTSA